MRVRVRVRVRVNVKQKQAAVHREDARVGDRSEGGSERQRGSTSRSLKKAPQNWAGIVIRCMGLGTTTSATSAVPQPRRGKPPRRTSTWTWPASHAASDE